jgi:hypothetical protein
LRASAVEYFASVAMANSDISVIDSSFSNGQSGDAKFGHTNERWSSIGT